MKKTEFKRIIREEVKRFLIEKQWINKATSSKGALRRKLNIGKADTIPVATINKKLSTLKKKSKGDKTLSKPELKFMRQLNLAKTLRKLSK